MRQTDTFSEHNQVNSNGGSLVILKSRKMSINNQKQVLDLRMLEACCNEGELRTESRI
jgi:hypothetical protein